eukprot:3145408-Pleurochrysis_carterae.AAC.1
MKVPVAICLVAEGKLVPQHVHLPEGQAPVDHDADSGLRSPDGLGELSEDLLKPVDPEGIHL